MNLIKHWFLSKKPESIGVQLPWGKITICFVVLLSFFGWLSHSDIGFKLEAFSARRVEFFLRNKMGKAPALDPKIKIFIFDDPMSSELQKSELSLKEWAAMLKALAPRKPANIFIDKIFGFPGEDGALNQEFVETLQSIDSNIVVGSFYAYTPISSREPINAPSEGGREPQYDFDISSLSDNHPLKKTEVRPFYGPSVKVKSAFSSIGHIAYEKNGYLYPFVRTEENRAVPHIGFWANNETSFRNNKILSGSNEIRLNRYGLIPVNLNSKKYYFSKTLGMAELYKRAFNGKPITPVKEGDTVVLLPLMYTGTTDWVSTPVEDMPGGFVFTAMINSTLKNEFLSEIDGSIAFTSLIVVLGTLAAAFLNPANLMILGITVGLLFPVLGFWSFVNNGILLPWLYPSLGWMFSIFGVYFLRSQREKTEQLRLASELETASLVQELFYPPMHVTSKYLEIAGYRESASECSGDWWYFLQHKTGSEYVMIADAMGHGTPAALLTAMAYSCFQSLIVQSDEPPSPAEFFERFNAVVFDALDGKMLMSAWVGKFDTVSNEFHYSSAGHPFPLLIPQSIDGATPKKVKAMRGGGSPIGFDKDTVFENKVLKITGGERIFAYTDGLLESHNPSKPDWKLKQLQKFMEGWRGKTLENLSKTVFGQAREYHGDYMKADDVTYFILEFRKQVEKNKDVA